MTEDLVEQYQSLTEGLADDSSAAVAAIWAAVVAGTITATEAEELLVLAIAAANATAATLADAYVSAQIEQTTAVPAPATGRPPADDTPRLAVAVATILGDPDPDTDPAPRLDRLARAEPLDTAQQTAVAVMRSHPQVRGWRYRLSADACELCRWYAADGRVYRVTRTFKQPHPGCNCQPEPVTR